MIALVGKMACGKTTILKELVRDKGFKKLVTYTTRPMRIGEQEGVDYYFIEKEDFLQKVKAGFFLEYTQYYTSSGIWYYGTALEDMEKADDKTVVIVNPYGLPKLKEKFKDKCVVVYVYSRISVLRKRALSRGDNAEEVSRRMQQDNIDFASIVSEADISIINDNKSINEVVNELIFRLNEIKGE